jgi:hypothetical protein
MFEKRGCQVVLAVIGLLLAIGLLNTGTCQAGGGGQQSIEAEKVATVGGRAISYGELVRRYEELRQGRPQTDSSSQFTTGIQALDGLVTEAALASLAGEKGVTLTDEQAVSLFKKENETMLAQAKLQLVQQGLVKPGADDKAFDEAFKKVQGVTLKEAAQQAVKEFADALADPDKKFRARQTVLGLAVRDRYRADAADTLADLEKSYQKFKVLRIPFDDLKSDLETRKKAAEAAAKELAGGAKPEAVLAKYAPKASKESMELDRALIEAQAGMEQILELKPGQSTGVLDQFGTPVVYALLGTLPGLPPDFAKNKDALLRQFREREADKRLQADLAARKEPSKIAWGDPALQAAYSVWSALTNPAGKGPQERRARLKELSEECKTVAAKTPLGASLARLASFAAFENYFLQLTPDQQAEERGARIENLRTALEDTEDLNLRLTLYDMLLEEGQFEEAVGALQEAAASVNGYEQQDMLALSEVQTRLGAAKKNPKIEKEWLKGVEAELARWAKDRAEYEQEQKRLEADRKLAEAEDAKREAEEKAKLEAEKKAAAEKKAGR